MTTSNVNFAAAIGTEKSVATQPMSKEIIADLIAAGFIREDYLQLRPNFNGWYSVGKVEYIKKHSKKLDREIMLPKVPLKRNTGTMMTWGTMLTNAVVLESTMVNTPIVELEEGRDNLPIWFKDDFMKEFPNLQKLDTLKNEDGSFTFHDKYYIVGALVNRSRVDETRWSISANMYEKGNLFLEFAKISNPGLTYIYEDQIIEISKRTKTERTFESATVGEVTLPSFKELKVLGNAKVDPCYANAQFILAKTW